MKHTHPKILAERRRLRLKLEVCEQNIKEDLEEIKQATRPLEMAKAVISSAADTFRDNSFATQGVRLALTMLPRRARHPLVGIAVQIAVPLLLRNLPNILIFLKSKAQAFAASRLEQEEEQRRIQ